MQPPGHFSAVVFRNRTWKPQFWSFVENVNVRVGFFVLMFVLAFVKHFMASFSSTVPTTDLESWLDTWARLFEGELNLTQGSPKLYLSIIPSSKNTSGLSKLLLKNTPRKPDYVNPKWQRKSIFKDRGKPYRGLKI